MFTRLKQQKPQQRCVAGGTPFSCLDVINVILAELLEIKEVAGRLGPPDSTLTLSRLSWTLAWMVRSWGISNIKPASGYLRRTLPPHSHMTSQYKIDGLCLWGELWAQDVFVTTTALTGGDRQFWNDLWVMVGPELLQRASPRTFQQALNITSCQQGAHRCWELCRASSFVLLYRPSGQIFSHLRTISHEKNVHGMWWAMRLV